MQFEGFVSAFHKIGSRERVSISREGLAAAVKLDENGRVEPDIHLYWYGVNNCAGYQIRQALQPNVSGGADAWGTSAENGLLLLDTRNGCPNGWGKPGAKDRATG